jgi:hypothetical protein
MRRVSKNPEILKKQAHKREMREILKGLKNERHD